MPLDPLSAGLGLGLGVLATVFVYELVFGRVQNREHTKMTQAWSLTGLGGPVSLAAARVGDVELPAGSRVLVGRGAFVPKAIAEACQVRETSEVPGNFALLKGSTLVFAADPRPGVQALWSYEEQVGERLRETFEHAWARAVPIVPVAAVESLASFEGQMVSVQGSVRDVAEKGGVHYLRLMEKGVAATVASAEGGLVRKGQVIRATGTVERAPVGGEPVLRAMRVEAVG